MIDDDRADAITTLDADHLAALAYPVEVFLEVRAELGRGYDRKRFERGEFVAFIVSVQIAHFDSCVYVVQVTYNVLRSASTHSSYGGGFEIAVDDEERPTSWSPVGSGTPGWVRLVAAYGSSALAPLPGVDCCAACSRWSSKQRPFAGVMPGGRFARMEGPGIRA
jgi:hypothetical protein